MASETDRTGLLGGANLIVDAYIVSPTSGTTSGLDVVFRFCPYSLPAIQGDSLTAPAVVTITLTAASAFFPNAAKATTFTLDCPVFRFAISPAN